MNISGFLAAIDNSNLYITNDLQLILSSYSNHWNTFRNSLTTSAHNSRIWNSTLSMKRTEKLPFCTSNIRATTLTFQCTENPHLLDYVQRSIHSSHVHANGIYSTHSSLEHTTSAQTGHAELRHFHSSVTSSTITTSPNIFSDICSVKTLNGINNKHSNITVTKKLLYFPIIYTQSTKDLPIKLYFLDNLVLVLLIYLKLFILYSLILGFLWCFIVMHILDFLPIGWLNMKECWLVWDVAWYVWWHQPWCSFS